MIFHQYYMIQKYLLPHFLVIFVEALFFFLLILVSLLIKNQINFFLEMKKIAFYILNLF